MLEDLEFVRPSDFVIERGVSKRSYPVPFPGNIRPTKKPDFSTLVLYQIMRGRGLNNSFKRMVGMMYDIDEVENVVRLFVKKESEHPDDSGYLNLAKAYAEYSGLKFDYDSVDFGNKLRVWGSDKEEWNFEIRRGEHLIRGVQKRDYSKMLRVNRLDMISYKKLNRDRKDLIEPFSKKKRAK